LFLWSHHGDVEVLFGDPLAMWKAWAEDLRGHAVESGPQMAEENPGALVAALTEFLGDSAEKAGLHEAPGG
jgi:haloacetate dehalogenase